MMRFKLVLEVIESENLCENARVVGDYLLDGLKNLETKYPEKLSNARGRGLMCAIDLPNGAERDAVRDQLYRENLIILGCGDQSLRFRPHLNVTETEIQMALDKIESVITSI
jgi:L-lysine 6-transaminase